MINQKALLPIVLVPAGVLTIPAAAMLLRIEGWDWGAADFVVMGGLLAAAVAAYQFVAVRTPNRAYRFAAGLAVFTGLVLIWLNAAVGLIGSEDNPANLLYSGVIIIGLGGAAIARLQPLGMSRALAMTALAQFLVPIVALIIWRPDFSPGVLQIFLLNFCFVLLFAGSALGFRRSARAGTGWAE